MWGNVSPGKIDFIILSVLKSMLNSKNLYNLYKSNYAYGYEMQLPLNA